MIVVDGAFSPQSSSSSSSSASSSSSFSASSSSSSSASLSLPPPVVKAALRLPLLLPLRPPPGLLLPAHLPLLSYEDVVAVSGSKNGNSDAVGAEDAAEGKKGATNAAPESLPLSWPPSPQHPFTAVSSPPPPTLAACLFSSSTSTTFRSRAVCFLLFSASSSRACSFASRSNCFAASDQSLSRRHCCIRNEVLFGFIAVAVAAVGSVAAATDAAAEGVVATSFALPLPLLLTAVELRICSVEASVAAVEAGGGGGGAGDSSTVLAGSWWWRCCCVLLSWAWARRMRSRRSPPDLKPIACTAGHPMVTDTNVDTSAECCLPPLSAGTAVLMCFPPPPAAAAVVAEERELLLQVGLH
mmetsp:Transcript_8616/g.14586  ORF Transcript_8616/g.14586 Transcript_8616/m.14586 type:complete len:356 (+) Transcript_8616:78-1145(+)